MSTVAVLLATGFEELEAITVIDVLRRAGCEVRILSADDTDAVCSTHEVTVAADAGLSAVGGEHFDLVVCPGGMPGATHLAENEGVCALLRRAWDSGAMVAAICAGPLALHAAGLLEGRRFTAYPGHESAIAEGHWTGVNVEEDERVITSRGPGTALEFALHLAGLLEGDATAAKLRKQMLVS
ncbi:MAG: DJ-1 family glyoxalase III [Verrucomicrobiota bacterium]